VDFELTSEQELMRDAARRMAQQVIAPRLAANDRTRALPKAVFLEIFSAVAQLGLTAPRIPQEAGGAGISMLDYGLMFEEIPPCISMSMLSQDSCISRIYAEGTADQRARFMPDLIAGRIDYWCPTVTVAIPQINNQTVRALAILTIKRSPNLPDLSSAHEQGLVDFNANTWNALFLPKGTPATIVRKLNAAAVAAMETPSVEQRLREVGAIVVGPDRRSPEYLQTFVASEIRKWSGPIKASGLSIE